MRAILHCQTYTLDEPIDITAHGPTLDVINATALTDLALAGLWVASTEDPESGDMILNRRTQITHLPCPAPHIEDVSWRNSL